MLQAIADPILPIFAVLAVGFLFCRLSVFDAGHATAINRFVFYLAAPALVFVIFARAPLGNLNLSILASYFAAEVIIYCAVTWLAHFVFRLSFAESLLLGMTAIFSNHVFFVLPIASLVYGPSVAIPIGGVIIVDVVSFCVTVFLVEAATSNEGGLRNAVAGLARNPFIYAPILGAAAWWAGDYVPSGIMTFAGFAGAAAAPVSLFALGIILAGLPLRPIGWIVVFVVCAKLLMHPSLVAFGNTMFGDNSDWGPIAVLVAAGPCGAMPFVIATQYGVEVKRISKAVLISTVLSVVTLSVLI
jgi:predicted permease